MSMTPLEALDELEHNARGNPLAGGKGNPEHAAALAQLPAIREAVRAVEMLEQLNVSAWIEKERDGRWLCEYDGLSSQRAPTLAAAILAAAGDE